MSENLQAEDSRAIAEIENSELKQPNNFYLQLDRILQLLDTRHNQYTDSDPDGETLDINDDVEVYDKVDKLIQNSDASDYTKEELRMVQRKIREAFLLAKDLKENLQRFE